MPPTTISVLWPRVGAATAGLGVVVGTCFLAAVVVVATFWVPAPGDGVVFGLGGAVVVVVVAAGAGLGAGVGLGGLGEDGGYE